MKKKIKSNNKLDSPPIWAVLIFVYSYVIITIMMKRLYIIAGPNGSGKTTLAKELIKEEAITFLNADEIAEKLGDSIGVTSGKLLLNELEKCFEYKKSIVLESTIAGNYHNRIIKRAKKDKYEIILVYVFLSSVEQNLARIQQRVKLGGHDVPESDVRRRYKRSLHNFPTVCKGVNQWELYYNGENSYELVARGTRDVLEIMDDALYNKFKKEAK
jgi:predicted ABC-type ATPase